MARPDDVADGGKIKHTWHNSVKDDMVSQSDTSDQNMASNLIFAAGKSPQWSGSGNVASGTSVTLYFFTKSGTSPIVFAHGVGSEPTGVVGSALAAQPYALGFAKDATNITVRHSAGGSLTVMIIVWKEA